MCKKYTRNNVFEKQSKILKQQLLKKGYPKSLIKGAYEKAKTKIQIDLLKEKEELPQEKLKQKIDTNFITTYNCRHREIRKILRKDCFLLGKDPYLSPHLTTNPKITYKGPPTLKKMIAPSRIKHQLKEKNIVSNSWKFEMWKNKVQML